MAVIRFIKGCAVSILSLIQIRPYLKQIKLNL